MFPRPCRQSLINSFHNQIQALVEVKTLRKMKGDTVVNAAITSQVLREAQWANKSSTAVTCENMIAKCVENGDFMTPTSENTNTWSIRSELLKAKTAVKKSINEEILDNWNTKVSKLLMQGELTKLLMEQEQSVTW